jgi:branched-chain amino acid transport system permease protein
VTGGDDGLVGVPRPPVVVPGILHLDVSTVNRFYYVILVLTLVALYVLWRVIHSPLGLTLRAIRDNPTRVSFAGLPVRRYRLISFIISGVYAGLAGALMAPLNSSANPVMAHWTASADPVLATLLGGAHSFAGPLLGAFLLYMIKDFIVRYTQYHLLVLGTVVVILVLGFRGGIVSALRSTVWPRLTLLKWPVRPLGDQVPSGRDRR